MGAGPRARGADSPGPWSDLGSKCAERRIFLGLTQAEASSLAGVSLDTVKALEAGRTGARLDILVNLATALGLRIVVGTGPETSPAVQSGAVRILRRPVAPP